MPDLSLEHSLGGIICGIDEAGRGPWAGPVVASAVVLGATIPSGINDSKKLSKKKREKLFDEIMNSAEVGIGIASVAEIDNLNILSATKIAMQRAFAALPAAPEFALVDGNQLPNLPCKMQYIIKGDSVSLSIAAASIIAKVTRDRIMTGLAAEFPHYNWQKNKGYGTADHIKALELYGVSAHHRTSYAPIKAFLGNVKYL